MAQKKVSIQDNKYDPHNVQINVGDTVLWTNVGNHTHTVTADNGSFESGDLAHNQQFSKTFGSVGATTYYCRKHGHAMNGIVTVT
jgi:plastocyanin